VWITTLQMFLSGFAPSGQEGLTVVVGGASAPTPWWL
jgi:hypothetical protein